MISFKELFLERTDSEKITQTTKIIDEYIQRVDTAFDKYYEFLTNIPLDGDTKLTHSDYGSKVEYQKHILGNSLSDLVINENDLNTKIRFVSNEKNGGEYKNNIVYIYDTELTLDYEALTTLYSYNTLTDEINDSKEAIGNFKQGLDKHKKVIFHELIHLDDDNRIKKNNRDDIRLQDLASKRSTKARKKIMNSSLNSLGLVDQDKLTNSIFDDYVNRTWEVNAHTLDKIFKHHDVKSVSEFINRLKESNFESDWISSLSEKNKRRVYKRLYDYYKK